MSQPALPLFLSRQSSDYSQLPGWRTVRPGRNPLHRWRGSARLRSEARQVDLTEPAERPPNLAKPASSVSAPVGGTDPSSRARSRAVWAVVVTGLALFMSSLDNLVVS